MSHEKTTCKILQLILLQEGARSCKLSCIMCKNLAVLHVIWPLSCKSCKICLQESCKNIFHGQDSCTSIPELQCKILQEILLTSCKKSFSLLARSANDFLQDSEKKKHYEGSPPQAFMFRSPSSTKLQNVRPLHHQTYAQKGRYPGSLWTQASKLRFQTFPPSQSAS